MTSDLRRRSHVILMRRVLVQFAHPVFERSRVQRRLLDAIRGMEHLTIRDLYEEYPTLAIDGWYLFGGHFERWQYSTRRMGLLGPDRATPDFRPLSAKLATPRPWTRDDFARLKVTPPEGYFTTQREPPTPLELLSKIAVRWPKPVDV